MSSALYRLGRFAASHPWRVIGVWVLVAVVVVSASSAFGRELEDSFEVPGVDSQVAVDLLSAAGSEQAGLTARLVFTPPADGETLFDSQPAREDLAAARAAL